MGFDNNSSNNGSQGRPQREEVFNKVSFTSVKLGQTKQGSPTLGLYLGGEQMKKLHALLTELVEKGENGCKLSCIVIHGKEYDSGYTYVNPKEARAGGDRQGNGVSEGAPRQSSGGFNRRPNSGFGKAAGGNTDDKSAARSFFQSKRVPEGN
jgi:hypothetical protein